MYVIKIHDVYIKSGKEDTTNKTKAKKFNTEEAAIKFIHKFIGFELVYEVIKVKEES
jgi:hypothetical protein